MATAQLQVNNESPAIRMAEMARDLGVPKDAMERFAAAGYIPQPKQLMFHAAARECDHPGGPVEIGLGGARSGSKSHTVFAQIGLDDCQRFPGVKFLYLRKIGKSARESFDDLRRKILRGVPHAFAGNSGVLRFANGSQIRTGHFNNENDIDGYLGIEYDGIAVEEATQLSEKKYIDINTCRRTSKDGWRPRTYTTTNPGGIGHAWYKSKFIIPRRQDRETSTRFIPTTYKDNVFTNSEYVETLNALKGWQLKAWRDGEWDIPVGQFFTGFIYDRHVIPAFRLPSHWRVWCAFDYGYQHPTACYLLAEFDGCVYVIDEYVRAKKLPRDNAQGIKDMLARNGVSLDRLWTFVAGEDVFAKRGDENGKTISEQYEQYGIKFEHANIDRINGAAELINRLGDPEDDIESPARLQIFDRCHRLIECIPELRHDPHRPEDVLKVDVDDNGIGGDDPYDALRYGLMATKVEQVYRVHSFRI